jgi:hypothetical protein
MLRFNLKEEEGLYVMIVEKRSVTCTFKDPEVNKTRNVLIVLVIFIEELQALLMLFAMAIMSISPLKKTLIS